MVTGLSLAALVAGLGFATALWVASALIERHEREFRTTYAKAGCVEGRPEKVTVTRLSPAVNQYRWQVEIPLPKKPLPQITADKWGKMSPEEQANLLARLYWGVALWGSYVVSADGNLSGHELLQAVASFRRDAFEHLSASNILVLLDCDREYVLLPKGFHGGNSERLREWWGQQWPTRILAGYAWPGLGHARWDWHWVAPALIVRRPPATSRMIRINATRPSSRA